MGTGKNETNSEKVYSLEKFINKKIYSLAVGDYHTILIASGCNCVETINGTSKECKGRNECNGGCDVYGWGQNNHGSVNGIPSEEDVSTPKVVPYFNSRKSLPISLVAICRSRSIAVSNHSQEVFEWGYRIGDRYGVHFEVVYNLPGRCIEVQAGLEFNMFLLEDGTVWISGQISQDTDVVFSAANHGTGENPLVNLTDILAENNPQVKDEDGNAPKIKKICTGYSHAILLDE